MNRIILMVIKNFFIAPIWLFTIWKMGRKGDRHSDIFKYEYLQQMVRKINKTGKVDVEISGIENLPENDGFIMFPNHQGLFDVLALIQACPRPFSVVIKKEASNIILVKQVVRLIRGRAMDRSDIKASMRVIMDMAEDVKNGRNYVIFAEGTRSRNGNNILPFKGGTFKSATISKCPVIPVALINSFRPFDINSIKREKVQVRFLEPIYYNQYMGLKTHEIADMVHDKIQQEINENT